MRCAPLLALTAACLTSACATTPPLSAPRISLQRPSECLTACPSLPPPTAGDELAVTLWTLDLIDAAAECRRMHETCRRAKD
jgi:hypothetical protein